MARKESKTVYGRGVYRSYHWNGDQDPIVDLMLELKDKVGMSDIKLSEASGVTTNTFSNWWIKRSTKRPSFGSTAAVVRAMGGEILIKHGRTYLSLENQLNGAHRARRRQ